MVDTGAVHIARLEHLSTAAPCGSRSPRWSGQAANVQILDAICRQDADRADALVRQHITQASGFMVSRLQGAAPGVGQGYCTKQNLK